MLPSLPSAEGGIPELPIGNLGIVLPAANGEPRCLAGEMRRDIPDLRANKINLSNHEIQCEGVLVDETHISPNKCDKCSNMWNLAKLYNDGFQGLLLSAC